MLPSYAAEYFLFLKKNIHHYYSMEYLIEAEIIQIPDVISALLKARSILCMEFNWTLEKIDEFCNAAFKQQCFMFSDTITYYLRLKSLFNSVGRNVIQLKKHNVFLNIMCEDISYELTTALKRFCRTQKVDLNERMSLSWKECGF